MLLCAKCRSRLEDGEGCDIHPRDEPVDLGTAEGRSLLRERMYGSARLRGIASDAAHFDPKEDGILGGIRDLFTQAPVELLAPRGVSSVAGKYTGFEHGEVSSVEGDIESPVSGLACAAWGAVLRMAPPFGTGPIVLVDGFCADFELTLDDGRVVRVASRRCRVRGITETYDDLDALLQSIEPNVGDDPEAADFPFFPAATAEESLAHVGDRVRFRAALDSNAGSYRAANRLMSSGPIDLVVLKRGDS